jgi:hypothetical protein
MFKAIFSVTSHSLQLILVLHCAVSLSILINSTTKQSGTTVQQDTTIRLLTLWFFQLPIMLVKFGNYACQIHSTNVPWLPQNPNSLTTDETIHKRYAEKYTLEALSLAPT